jgi:putative peptidoglycan lipid II flippase
MVKRRTLAEEGRILKVATLVFILAVLTKALQVIFYPLVAAFFGTSGEFESFVVALSIPTLISTGLLGNFGAAFILIFTEQRMKYGEKSAWDFASSLINIVLLGAIAITVVGVLLSPWLIRFLVPGMKFVYRQMGTQFLQILFITVFFFELIMILAAILQSHQFFILPVGTWLISNVVLIAIILTLKQRMGIYVLALANILSFACAAALLLVGSKGLWWGRYTFKINAEQSVKEALRMLIGVSIIGAFWQINLIISRFFASFLPTGSIATLEYASRFVILIIDLLSLSVVIPLYQKMSSEAAIGDRGKVMETFSLGIKITAVVLFPLMTFVIFLRFPIFQVFLEYGKFTTQNTAEVSSVFLYLSLSLIGGGLGQIIMYAYCAFRKMRLLLILFLGGLMLNIVLSAILHKVMGVEGLALAMGITTLSGSIFSLGVLNKEVGGLNLIYLTKFTLKTILAAILSGILVWLLFLSMGHLVRMNLLSQIIKLGISALVFMVVYTFLMSFFRMAEINLVLNIVKDRLKSKSQVQL